MSDLATRSRNILQAPTSTEGVSPPGVQRPPSFGYLHSFVPTATNRPSELVRPPISEDSRAASDDVLKKYLLDLHEEAAKDRAGRDKVVPAATDSALTVFLVGMGFILVSAVSGIITLFTTADAVKMVSAGLAFVGCMIAAGGVEQYRRAARR
jgi:hypothetical protein